MTAGGGRAEGKARATLGAVLHARNEAYARVQWKRIDERGAGAESEAAAARDGLAHVEAAAGVAGAKRNGVRGAGAVGWIVWALALALMYAVLATDMFAVLFAALADVLNLFNLPAAL